MPLLYSIFYRGLFVILAAVFILFVSVLLLGNTAAWATYGYIYLGILLGYTWILFIILFIGDMRKKRYQKYDGERITVVMPCYNEEPELLRRAIESILKAKGNKELVVVDDGSTNDVGPLLDHFSSIGVRVMRFERNKGKRKALHTFIKGLTDSDFVVTVDSDTILDKDALIRVVEPLKDNDVGASTGDVRLINEKENWLTGMIALYYWIGLHIYKQAQSNVGNVVCCSGCLAAYRASLMKEVIDEFLNQRFYGEQCTHSEDRHLTNLILKRGYKVLFVPEAISYTHSPSTVWGFMKQQQRWKRGYIRESVYTLTYAWKTRPFLFFQILLWDLTAPFFTFGMRLAVILTVILSPAFFVVYILPAWILFMITRYIFVVLKAPRFIPYMFVYMIFYEMLMYWMNIYALFTVRNKSWVTR